MYLQQSIPSISKHLRYSDATWGQSEHVNTPLVHHCFDYPNCPRLADSAMPFLGPKHPCPTTSQRIWHGTFPELFGAECRFPGCRSKGSRNLSCLIVRIVVPEGLFIRACGNFWAGISAMFSKHSLGVIRPSSGIPYINYCTFNYCNSIQHRALYHSVFTNMCVYIYVYLYMHSRPLCAIFGSEISLWRSEDRRRWTNSWQGFSSREPSEDVRSILTL